MKSIGIKLPLSALAVSLLFMSPAFAKKAHHVATDAPSHNTVPGYDKDGAVVAIPSPDQAPK